MGKLAVDSLIQDHLAEAVRTSAFARSETVLQLAWVIGGIYACVVPADATIGLYSAAVLLVGSIGIAFLANWQTAVVIAIYLVIQLGYCFGLKHQAVLDICIVSSGFLLRAVAGGAAAEIALSQWFLLVTSQAVNSNPWASAHILQPCEQGYVLLGPGL